MSSPLTPENDPAAPAPVAPAPPAPQPPPQPLASGPQLPPQPQYAGQIAGLQRLAPGAGPIGKVRDTGMCVLLAIVTLGIYSLVWYYRVHDEMKRHTGDGLGGPVALLLAFFIGIVAPFLTSAEVGGMYERRGEVKPVSAVTALWYFPGIFILVGPIIWFVKTNGALNNYWRSLGAR
jgi:hypothetical protein